MNILKYIFCSSFNQGQLYDLEFNENGKTYKELITVDNQLKIVVYDVPKHGSRGAATYLKDFINVSLTIYTPTTFFLLPVSDEWLRIF